MSSTWQTKTRCRKCAAGLVASVEPGGPPEASLAVFYCPACGDRTQVEVPAGYDPLSVTAAPDEG
jgi:transcription elongation factor Elf1